MKLYSHFSLARLSNSAIILLVGFLFGCQPIDTVSPTPTIEIIVSTAPYVTETPVPACVLLSDIELTVDPLSESSVHIKITGLMPNEPVYTIFRSKISGQQKELGCCSGEKADASGVYELSEGLRVPTIADEFKEWQVLVVHSRGSTCGEFSFP